MLLFAFADLAESRAAREALSREPRYSGLVSLHKAYALLAQGRGTGTSEQRFWSALVLMLDPLVRAIYRARSQVPADFEPLTKLVLECGAILEGGV